MKSAITRISSVFSPPKTTEDDPSIPGSSQVLVESPKVLNISLNQSFTSEKKIHADSSLKWFEQPVRFVEDFVKKTFAKKPQNDFSMIESFFGHIPGKKTEISSFFLPVSVYKDWPGDLRILPKNSSSLFLLADYKFPYPIFNAPSK